MKNTLLECFKVLLEEYTDQPLAMHITLALADYDSIEYVDDKTLCESLEQYIFTLELDGQISKTNFDDGEEY